MPLFFPTQDQFTEWYKEAPHASKAVLMDRLQHARTFPEYSLLSAFICRCLSSLALAENETLDALQWAEQSMSYLEDKRTLKKAWGSDVDYTASLNTSLVLMIRCLSMGDEPSQWIKAERLSHDLLATGFPSIYQSNGSRDGVHVALMRMGILNRLGQHAASMELGIRLQTLAQDQDDGPTEARAGLHWAISALIQSKAYAMDERDQDADALLNASHHVLSTLMQNPSTLQLLQYVLPVVHEYAQRRLQKDSTLDTVWLQKYSGDELWALLDIVEQHSDAQDEILAARIVGLLDAMGESQEEMASA